MKRKRSKFEYKVKFPSIQYVEGEKPWITYFKKELFKKNQTVNLVITAMPGEGKSYTGISILEQIFGKKFKIFFKLHKFLKYVSENSPTGEGFLLDESGVDLGNLKYADLLNKSLHDFFVIQRHKNNMNVIVLPHFSQLSKGVRTLCNYHFKVEGFNSRNENVIRAYKLEYSGDNDKFYKKRLFVRSGRNGSFCSRLLMPKPSKEILESYEKRKSDYTKATFDNLAKQAEAFEAKKQKINRPYSLTIKQERILNFLKKGMLVPEIAKKEGIAEGSVYEQMKRMKRKGFGIRPKRKMVGVRSLAQYYMIRMPNETEFKGPENKKLGETEKKEG